MGLERSESNASPMKAVILAGGLGTRLRPVVPDRPKSMATAGDRPFLQHLIEQLRDQGFADLVMCVGHLAPHIYDYFSDGGHLGVRIRYAIETELLGTAGALRNAARWLDETFLLLNGDSYLEIDLRALVAAHLQHGVADPSALGTHAVVHAQDASAYGTVDLAADGRLVAFREKAAAGSGWVNAGVGVLEPAVLDLIPGGRPVSLERETYPLLLSSGYHLYAHQVAGFFVDIGTPQGYRRFQQYLEGQEL